eukprot:13783701-Alexandrium_andersonii.AAC.1
MSASLVGSEMCIRDSSWPTPGAGSLSGQRGCLPSHCGSCPGVCVWSRSVSYTHLTLPTICSV